MEEHSATYEGQRRREDIDWPEQVKGETDSKRAEGKQRERSKNFRWRGLACGMTPI